MKHQVKKCYLIAGLIILAGISLLICSCAEYVASAAGVPDGNANSPNPNSQHTIKIATKAGLGQYLVDHRGFALYYYSKDTWGMSNASKSLLKNWPPFFTNKFVVSPPLKESDFSNIKKGFPGYGLTNNQSCYRGWPLYYSDLDRKAGDTIGNGKDGFLVVSPNIKPAPDKDKNKGK